MLAPEIRYCQGGIANYSKQDVFSIGTLIYPLCGGVSPFDEAGGDWDRIDYDVSQLPRLRQPYDILQPLAEALLHCDPARRASCDSALLLVVCEIFQCEMYFVIRLSGKICVKIIW